MTSFSCLKLVPHLLNLLRLTYPLDRIAFASNTFPTINKTTPIAIKVNITVGEMVAIYPMPFMNIGTRKTARPAVLSKIAYTFNDIPTPPD